jgi:hypothetical protein
VLAAPQTPVVFAGPEVQSAVVQQPPTGMQRFVPGQFLNVLLVHAISHVPVVGLQVATPFDAGVGQDLHVGPQKLGLVSLWQMPAQLCVPGWHIPMHALALGMHVPAHSLPPGHVGTQAKPSHVTVPPPEGAVQAEQDVRSLGPQVATSLLSTHLPPHT